MAKKSTQKKDTTEELVEVVVEGIQDKKGEDIVVLDLRKIKSAVCSFFVVCHGNSDRQVEALADSVKQMVRKKVNDSPIGSEGTSNAEWVLLDYFDVIVHIFKKETRDFYQLEELWADAEIKEIVSEY